jgi:glucose-1-phosphate cytidylyltransferase
MFAAGENMKVIILAGGRGTRLAEETEVTPKPMVEIGGHPMLWHVMSCYSRYGINEFFVALGYKGEVIKRYFLDYHKLSRNLRVDLATGAVDAGESQGEDWNVNLIDTGMDTNTGGRVKRMEQFVSDGTFMLTYGDGVSDVNLDKLLKFHRSHGKIATVTAVRPQARFGSLTLDGDAVTGFAEKSQLSEGWINGGFLVFEASVFRYLGGDNSSLEADTLKELAQAGQLVAYRHDGFWQCMDTIRDKSLLQKLWQDGAAPWKVQG